MGPASWTPSPSQFDTGYLSDLPLQREPLEPLLGVAWERRRSVRLVDTLYLALAERLDAIVITTDKRLVRIAKGLARLPQDFQWLDLPKPVSKPQFARRW